MFWYETFIRECHVNALRRFLLSSLHKFGISLLSETCFKVCFYYHVNFRKNKIKLFFYRQFQKMFSLELAEHNHCGLQSAEGKQGKS
jgi:hypothetical protein